MRYCTRIAASYLDIVGVEHVLDRDGAASHAVLENLRQRGAGFHRAGHGLGVVVLDRPQSVFDLLGQRRIRPFELRVRAGFRPLDDANPAGADMLQRRVEALALRQRFRVCPADQNAPHGNFVDRCRYHPARGGNFDLEAARQPFVLAALLAVAFLLALPQQHGATRLELLRKIRDGASGLGDAFAVRLGFLGRAVDFGGAVADRGDEAGMRRPHCRPFRRWLRSARRPRR